MKGVGIFAQHDEGGFKLKIAKLLVFSTLCLLVLTSSNAIVEAKILDPSVDLSEPVMTEARGRSLLVEEVTTTWCPTCAEIDPYLMGVADAHGSRIAMVSYHPSDGVDGFQPPAAQHRIDRLGIVHGNAIPSPTFFVEGMNPRSGIEAWSDVQRDILDSELTRQETSTLQFQVTRNDERVTAKIIFAEVLESNRNNSQLTFLIIEHKKMVPNDVANPGEEHRDRVLVATAECHFNTSNIEVSIGLLSAEVSQGCSDDFEVTFTELQEFSILLVHESSEHAIEHLEATLGTFGAVEFAYRSRDSPQSWSFTGIVLLVAAGAGLIAVLPRKDRN